MPLALLSCCQRLDGGPGTGKGDPGASLPDHMGTAQFRDQGMCLCPKTVAACCCCCPEGAGGGPEASRVDGKYPFSSSSKVRME